MLTSIEGTYENGKILLTENPSFNEKVKVIVTFLNEKIEVVRKKPRPFGLMKDKIKISDDFDEPLEDLKEYI